MTGDGAGREAIRLARRREQRHDDLLVDAPDAGVDVRLGRGADAAPGDRVGECVALKADEFQGLPGRCACGRLVAALRLATSTAGAPVALPGTVIPASDGPSLFADAALIESVADAAAAARAAPMPRARRRFMLLVMVIVLPDPGRRGVRRPTSDLVEGRTCGSGAERIGTATSTGQAARPPRDRHARGVRGECQRERPLAAPLRRQCLAAISPGGLAQRPVPSGARHRRRCASCRLAGV